MKYERAKTSRINEIKIDLKSSAAELWVDAPRRNMNHAIVVVLDNNVLSVPRVFSVIARGIHPLQAISQRLKQNT